MQRAVVVYNPAARNAPSRERLEAAAKALQPQGWQVSLRITQAPRHATDLAREAAESGAEVVFACGGDGTLNEVVNGLVGSQAALALMRGGMGDVFGKEVGIPRPPEEAIRVLLEGQRRRFDLGRANQRYFLLMAGVGLDAQVVRSVPALPKRLLGSTSYGIWGALDLARHRSRDVILCIDGRERAARLYWLLISNTRSYGGIAKITARALVDDGLLDAYLFEGHGPAWLAATAARLATGRQDSGRGVSFQRVRELDILSLGLPVQVDGEYIGETPVRFSAVPSALDVLLPQGKADALFGSTSA